MILSILICHLKSRSVLLERLLKCLRPQVAGKPVEILIEADNGEVSTGTKRNALLKKATAEYCTGFDDDDLPSSDFVEKILKALESKPDCLSLNGIMFRDGHVPRRFSHSLKHGIVWREETQGGTYLRPPNHINVVRRELALKAGFPDKKIGEDHEFATRLFPLLKTEVEINEPIYFYFA